VATFDERTKLPPPLLFISGFEKVNSPVAFHIILLFPLSHLFPLPPCGNGAWVNVPILNEGEEAHPSFWTAEVEHGLKPEEFFLASHIALPVLKPFAGISLSSLAAQ